MPYSQYNLRLEAALDPLIHTLFASFFIVMFRHRALSSSFWLAWCLRRKGRPLFPVISKTKSVSWLTLHLSWTSNNPLTARRLTQPIRRFDVISKVCYFSHTLGCLGRKKGGTRVEAIWASFSHIVLTVQKQQSATIPIISDCHIPIVYTLELCSKTWGLMDVSCILGYALR